VPLRRYGCHGPRASPRRRVARGHATSTAPDPATISTHPRKPRARGRASRLAATAGPRKSSPPGCVRSLPAGVRCLWRRTAAGGRARPWGERSVLCRLRPCPASAVRCWSCLTPRCRLRCPIVPSQFVPSQQSVCRCADTAQQSYCGNPRWRTFGDMATLVSFHAHPDDECITCGGVMRMAAEQGHRVVLVVATRGELGEIPPGLLDDGEELWQRRVAETHAAAEILGAHRVEFLGYSDSGMMGDATNNDAGTFWSAPVDEAAAKLTAILR